MAKRQNQGNIVAYISSFPPRECGIATFTQDLTSAIDKRFNPATKSRIVALNESPTTIYRYGDKVIDQVDASNIESYVVLAESLNQRDDIKVVSIQHEFGLFGGEWGGYLIPFLQVIKKPVMITLHSVLADPSDTLRGVVRFVADKASALIVMNGLSRDTLIQDYGIPSEKVRVIPHGIPHATFGEKDVAKEALGLKGRVVLSTFGLLSRDKGIEYAIRALPKVVKQYPNTLYLVLGITHPVVRRNDGEEYRNFLISEVRRLGLEEHVKFYNKYLSNEEIITYLKASDLYVFPCINPRQSVSGTLSYALGCGCPVVAVPNEYAKHIVTPQNGILVKFKDSKSIERALLDLVGDEKWRKSMSQSAYDSTRHMIWSNVAQRYFELYQEFADLEPEEDKLPEIKLDHLKRMTSERGMMHHARYSRPEKRFGHSMDDNARALIAAAKHYELSPADDTLKLMRTYLGFLKYVQRPNGTFANIVSSRGDKDKTTDDDVQGRGVWALGYVASREKLPADIRTQAERMFRKALPYVSKLTSPRAIAFSMTGLHAYLSSRRDPELLALFTRFADFQVDLFKRASSPDWQWFEDSFTYSNSKLSESLYYAYDILKKPIYLDVAQASLKFLSKITFEPNYYSPIGQNGWYFRYRKRAYFDQHPEDAAAMVDTKIAAYRVTHDRKHLRDALTAFRWFLGKNHLGQMVYNEVTGGCHDGLGKDALNLNQGAESSISYLLARLHFEDPDIKHVIKTA